MPNLKVKDSDYIKDINKITIVTVTGIAALAASMLIVESGKNCNHKDSSKISTTQEEESNKNSKIKLPATNAAII